MCLELRKSKRSMCLYEMNKEIKILNFSWMKKKKFVENPGIDPGTSHMLSERSTIWANSPIEEDRLVSVYEYCIIQVPPIIYSTLSIYVPTAWHLWLQHKQHRTSISPLYFDTKITILWKLWEEYRLKEASTGMSHWRIKRAGELNYSGLSFLPGPSLEDGREYGHGAGSPCPFGGGGGGHTQPEQNDIGFPRTTYMIDNNWRIICPHPTSSWSMIDPPLASVPFSDQSPFVTGYTYGSYRSLHDFR